MKFITGHGSFRAVRGRTGEAQIREGMVASTVQGRDVIDMKIGDVEKLAGIAAMRWLGAEPCFQLIGAGPG